jgi:hypothetical protein
VSAAVKGDFLHWFNEKYGVKQGCPSGPRSFILFICDLPAYVCPESEASKDSAVYLLGSIIKSLLWADDLVLFSRTEAGLQAQLSALYMYTVRDKLTVNVDKTVCMYISTRGSRDMRIYYGPPGLGRLLEQVSSFKYVGVWVDNKGTYDTNCKHTIIKARRAMFACMSKIMKLSINAHMSI